jgi:hypothetical protein
MLILSLPCFLRNEVKLIWFLPGLGFPWLHPLITFDYFWFHFPLPASRLSLIASRFRISLLASRFRISLPHLADRFLLHVSASASVSWVDRPKTSSDRPKLLSCCPWLPNLPSWAKFFGVPSMLSRWRVDFWRFGGTNFQYFACYSLFPVAFSFSEFCS